MVVAVTLALSPESNVRRATAAETSLPHVVSTSERVIEGRRVVERDEFAGLRARESRCENRVCNGRWFDGRRVYATDANETPIPLDAELSDLETSVNAVTTMVYAQPAFRAAGGTVEPLPPHQIRVRAPGGRPVTVTLDPATRLPQRVDDDDGEAVETLGDFRRVGPLVLPFRVARPGALVRYDARQIDPEPLAAPEGLAVRFPAKAEAAFTGKLPIVPCAIANQRLHCLLDTGSSGLSLGIRIAERMHLQPYGESEVAGFGRYATALVEATALLVAGATVERPRFTLLADPPPGVDVILGTDFFRLASVSIDYPAGHVVLAAPGSLARPGTGLPVAYRALRPELPVTLDGLATRLVVDTGDVAGIDVSYAFYRLHTDTFVLGGRTGAIGVGGGSDVLTGELREVTLGEERIGKVPLWVTRSLRETRGHIGAALLARYPVLFDLARDRIVMNARP